MNEIVSYETFEDMKAPGWSISKIESAPSYTHFLGRFSSWQQTDKLFLVPTRSLYTEVTFDFYEFDSWDGDSLYILIDGEWISLGTFSSAVDEGNRNGHHAQSDVSWWMHSLSAPTNAAFNNYPDQKHRFKVKVPARFTNRDGELKVGFQFATSDWITNESGGIDNVKVTSVYRCPHSEHDTHKERKSYQSPWSNKNNCIRRLVKENFEDGQITGWQHGRLDFQEGFSRFLGRYGKDEWTKKVFPVPTSAKSVRLQFDFYEFDDWGGSNHDDRFHFLINGESVHLNKFQDKDELFQSGKTSAGLRWSTRWLNTGKKRAANAAFNDQKHRVWVDIPPNVYSYDSSLHIRFMVSTDEDLSNESGGVDNLFLLGLFDSCEGGQSQYPNVKLLPNGEFYVIVEGQDGFTSVDEVQVLIKEAIMAKVNDYLVTPFPAGHCLENKQPFARVVLSQKQTWDDANGCPS